MVAKEYSTKKKRPPRRSYVLDPLNWGDMLSAMGLPVLAAVGFAQDMPDTRNEIRVHQFLYLDGKITWGCGAKMLADYWREGGMGMGMDDFHRWIFGISWCFLFFVESWKLEHFSAVLSFVAF